MRYQFIVKGKAIWSALLHSEEFSMLSLLVVTARLPKLMPLLEKTQSICPIYCAPQKVMK